jgi:hypothetical protein
MSLKLVVLLSLFGLVPIAAVSQTKPVTGSPHRTATHTSAPLPRPMSRTPLDRRLKPYLDARLAATAGVRSGQTAHALDQQGTTSASAQPNFGGYVDAPFYPARLEPSCVTDPFNCGVTVELTADFNKDGKPDIAVLQADGTLNILLNNGTGGLATPVSYLNPNYSSSFIQQAFVADVNNDGYSDIVAFDSSNGALIVYLNQKNGTFGAAQTAPLSQNAGTIASIAVGDINGDGFPDVVTIATNITSQTMTVVTLQSYLGKGSGSFTAPGASLTQTVTFPAQVQIPQNTGISLGDLNKDGKLDLAADFEEQTSQTAGTIVASFALGNGDGSFGAINVNNPISVPVQAPPGFPFLIFMTAGVQITDLNNDTNNDLAIDANGTLYVALGNGSGAVTSTMQTANFGGPGQVVYEDVTGDGIPDAVMDLGLLNVWVGKGDGTFSLPLNGNTFIEDGGSAQSLVLADFTGDGNIDIAQLGGDYKQVSIFAGNGKGVFTGAPALSSTTDAFWSPEELYLEAGEDIAGNGQTDPLFVDQSESAPYIVSGLSNGKGGLTYATALATTAVPTLVYIQPVAADFDGDGKQDLLIVDGALGNGLAVALSNGDGTFKTPVPVAMPTLDCELSYGATGDLNDDGNADIVITYPGDAACGGSDGTPSGYFVALGKGDGTFATPMFTASGNELYSAAIADINGDGNLDLVLNDEPFDGSGSFAVDLLTGNGDGTFAAGSSVFSNYLVSEVIAGDYNQDGKQDLILFTEGESTSTNMDDTAGIVLLPGNGDGTFGDSNLLAHGNFFLNGVLTDVNNDGIPDIVAALYQTTGQPNTYYGLSTLLGTGQGSFAAPVNALESLDSSLPLPGNFLSNNAPGVLVSTAYGTALYLGQGGSTISLAASAASINFGQAETLTATLAPSLTGRPAPTGTVSFYDGTTWLGSVAVSGATAAYSTSALAVGTHSVTAVYSGDSNFNPNTSTATSVAVSTLAPAFTLSANPGTVSVSIGQQGVATLTVAANATFSGNISFTCSGLPANATCSVNPSQVTLTAGSNATATLVVGTTTSAATNQQPLIPFSGFAGGLSLAGLVCCLGRRRFSRGVLSVVTLVLLGFATVGASGCGGGNGVKTATKGTYTVTITATPASSSAGAQTATVSVMVQ